MEPVSIIGLASSILTFVDFAAKIISTTAKVYDSAEGASLDTIRLEQVYDKLSASTAQLSTSDGALALVGANSLSHHPFSSNDGNAIKQLAKQCQQDCELLLDVLRKLKVENGGKKAWKSVKVAFRTRIEQKKIEDIQDRVALTQRAMSIHATSIIGSQLAGLTSSMNNLRIDNERLLLNQRSRMDVVVKGVEQLKQELAQVPRGQGSILNDSWLSPSQNPMAQLSGLLTNGQTQLQKLLSMEDQLTKEQAFLLSLDFETRSIRHEAIPQAHVETFEWIFKSGFTKWLENGSSVFWISGKAGSGKSTLMKFIASHLKTRELLMAWSSPKPITIASHYFWAAGSSIQKSHTGLLRTLLYDIFRQCPEYMAVASPSRWNQQRKMNRTEHSKLEPWSHHELSQALNALAHQDNLPTKFCFFIDGMDEYSGDHLELCAVLKDFSYSPNFKLCVSSRPWNVFKDSFGQDEQFTIRVHDLTQQDICNFTKDRLTSHPRWKACSFQKPAFQSIIHDIGTLAEGVFLWAFLVTRSLREGLTNGDGVEELRKRLDQLPTDLEHLFKHMLGQVDSFYHQRMAGMFQIALHAKAPLKLDIYGFHDLEYEDEDYAIKLPVQAFTTDQKLDLYEDTRRRVNSRSNGLLECSGVTYTVQFLHRTVSDFLRTKEMIDYIQPKCKPGFDVYLSVTRAFVALAKSTRFRDGVYRVPPPSRATGLLVDTLSVVLDYASQVSIDSLGPVSDLLDEAESALGEMFQTRQAIFNFNTCTPVLLFREELLRSNAAAYLAKKLEDIPSYLGSFQTAPISISVTAEVAPIETIQVLLKGGEDPNGVSSLLGSVEMSPWVHICFVNSPWGFTNPGPEAMNDLLDRGFYGMFLSFGANPNDGLLTCEFPVFAMYLMVIFCSPGYIRNIDEYLRILENFLRHGAKLGAAVSLNSELYSRLSNQLRWWPDPGTTSSVIGCILRGLESWKAVPGLRQANGRFMAAVAQVILTQESTPKMYKDELSCILLSVFGEHIAMPILRLIGAQPLGKKRQRMGSNEGKEIEPATQYKQRKS